MPIYDTICDNKRCENVVEQFLGIEEDPKNCLLCGNPMSKIPGGHFKLMYNPKKDMVAWGNEGYNTSMYWSEVRKQRAEGKKVKGANEE